MADDAIGIVEQERQAGFAEPLLLQHVLEPVEQNVAGDDAAAALLQRRAQGVAGLAGGVEDVRPGQSVLPSLKASTYHGRLRGS